jgi:hypothetical protein
MIWFNIKKLEKKLVNDDFSETLGYCYLITFLSAISILFFFPGTSSGNEELKIPGIILSLLISFWGFQKVFEINRIGSNKDFFKRLFVLSFVTGVRLCTGLVIFSFTLRGSKIFLENFDPNLIDGALLGSTSKLFVATIACLTFFVMLINSFKRINSPAEIEARQEV